MQVGMHMHLLHRYNMEVQHGGVALYIKSSLNVSATNVTSTSPYVETLSVKILIPHMRPIYACIVYAPEIRLDFFDNLDILLEELKDLTSDNRTNR